MMSSQYAGVSVVVGIILIVLAPLFMPGYFFIDSVDQTDFAAAVGALENAPRLAHFMTLLGTGGLLLLAYGIYSLYPAATRQGGFGGACLRFGILVSLLEWSILIIVGGMRHFLVHLTQRDPELFSEAALTIHTASVAVSLAALLIAPVATGLVGLGLSSRIPGMNLYKLASYLLTLAGVASMVVVIVALFGGGDDPLSYLIINNFILFVASFCLLVVGVGMYLGQEGLTTEEAS